MMKKSLLITIDWPPQRGGVANYLWNIYSRLPKQSVVVLGESLPAGKLAWLKIYFVAAKIIPAERIESVHISHILPMGYVAWMIKKIFGLPYIVYLHGMDILLARKSLWKKWWAKKILQGAYLVVANSRFTADEAIKAGAEEGKIEIVYPCPNFSIPQMAANFTNTDKNIILSVGRLVERKGFDKVIEAMPEILRDAPDAEYQIVGDGPYAAELMKLAKKLGVGDRVKFFPNINDAELPEFYKNCRIFAMPARKIDADTEGFGIVYLEAALFGKPSVAGNVGGAPEAVLNNQTGLIINPESPEEIARAIIKLLKDGDLCRAFGEEARARAEREFRWEAQIDYFKDLL